MIQPTKTIAIHGSYLRFLQKYPPSFNPRDRGLNIHRPFLKQNLRIEVRHNLLPIPNIHRPLPLLPLLKLHVICNKQAAENRLGCIGRKVAARTSLTSKPEM